MGASCKTKKKADGPNIPLWISFYFVFTGDRIWAYFKWG